MDAEKIKELKDDAGTVLVEFYASWCLHCQKMMPVVEDVRALLEGSANVYQFDIDDNQEFAEELDVSNIPTFIVFKGGNEMWRTSGEIDGNVLAKKVEEYL